MKVLVVAGTASGVGKTTVALGLIAALRRRGLIVQPYKVGPDYIDPTYHAQAAGRPCRNLDAWMLPEHAVRELFARSSADADVAVVEGVMGLFDGRAGEGNAGSTAHVARLLGAPVLLVIDAAKAARSVAATALGFARFDPRLTVAGVVLNNLGSERHRAMVADAVVGEGDLPVLGALTRDATLTLEERYLGLVPTAERALPDTLLDALAVKVEREMDVDRVLDLADASPPTATAASLFPAQPIPDRVRIGVARDVAFSFYYEDNLDLLRAWGAELVPFSPLADRALPHGISALYLGGGFPELYANRLADNHPLLEDARSAVAAGMPVVAECGGLMYLGETLTDRAGAEHRMAGVLPVRSSLARGRLTLGYREVVALRDSPLLRAAETVRGHEFHWSVADAPPADRAAYQLIGEGDRCDGFASGSLLGSYVHLHFGADPKLAPRFVDAALAFAGRWAATEQVHESTDGLRELAVGHRQSGCHAGLACHPERSEGSHGAETRSLRATRAAAPKTSLHVQAREHEIHRCALDDKRVQDDTRVQDGGLPARHGMPRRDQAPDGLDGTDAVAPGPLLLLHGYPPIETEALSLRRIEARCGDRLPADEPARSLVARLIYAAGDPAIAECVRWSDTVLDAAASALVSGAPFVTDVRMVAAGLDRTALDRLGLEPLIAIDVTEAGALAKRVGITRTAAGILALGTRLDGAVVAIGNAPTALLALLDLAGEGVARPAAVLGFPVGFVAAAESKDALAASGLPYVTILGTRGGSALATAAANLVLRRAAASARTDHNRRHERQPEHAGA